MRKELDLELVFTELKDIEIGSILLKKLPQSQSTISKELEVPGKKTESPLLTALGNIKKKDEGENESKKKTLTSGF